MDCQHDYAELVGVEGGVEKALSLFACMRCGMLKVGTNTIRISDARLDMDDKELRKAIFKDTGASVNALGNISGATTINLELGNVVTATAVGDVTFTFSNPPASGVEGGFVLELIAGGLHSISWPAAVIWSGGIAPTLSTNTSVLVFYTDDAGTEWKGTFVQDIARGASVQNSGWVAAGWSGPGAAAVSTLFRIDFENDLNVWQVRGSLSSARFNAAGTGNSSVGYIGGGTSPLVTTVDRVTYANDTPTTTVKGPLTVARSGLGGTGSSSFGYFGGGATPSATSIVDRIDYSNDTPTTTVRGPLSAVRAHVTATGHSSHGYFGGGYAAPGSPAYRSTVDRIDYAADAPTATARGPLSLGRGNLSAAGNSSYGWFGGGRSSPSDVAGYHTTVDRIEYANDTPTASVRGPLTQKRFGAGAVSNSSFGYWSGGYTLPGTSFSSVDRVTFSSDTPTATVRSKLTTDHYYSAGTNHHSLS